MFGDRNGTETDGNGFGEKRIGAETNQPHKNGAQRKVPISSAPWGSKEN